MTMQRLDGPHVTWSVADLLGLPPEAVELQPTAACHRTCVFCSHIVRNKRGGVLTQDLISQLLSDAEALGVEQIAISGGGEPLYWEGDLARVLERAHEFAFVTLTTSGDQFLDRERSALSPLALACLPHVDALILNVPGVDDASLREQIVGGPTWSQLARVLRLLVEYSGESGLRSFRVLCAVVVSRDNFSDIPRIDRVLHEIGVDEVYFKEYKLFGRDASRRPRARIDLREHGAHDWRGCGSPDLRRFIASLESPRDAVGVACWTNRIGLGAIIDPNGNVFACTPTVGALEHVIGNAWEQRLPEIWAGPARRETVDRLSRRSEAGGCPIECRYHAHNRVFASRREAGANAEPSAPLAWTSNAGVDNLRD